MKLKIHTTHDDIHELSKAAFDARESTATVRVPLAALKRVVMDHGAMLDKLKGEVEGDT